MNAHLATLCPRCKEIFTRMKRIGHCDHPFPGRPLSVYWVNRRAVAGGLIDLAVVKTATRAEAVELLKPALRHPVTSLPWTSMGLAAGLNEGEVREVHLVPPPTPSDERGREADRWRNRDR